MKCLFYGKILFSIIFILFCGMFLSCEIIDSLIADDTDGDGNGGNTDGDGNGGNTDGDGSDNDTYITDLCLGIDTANEDTITIENEPYHIITNQTELQAIGNDQNTLAAYYVLCENITINPPFTQAINPYTSEGDEFTGTLEGNHKTISNLKIQDSSSHFVGLFGKIGADGKVENLYLSLAGDANDPGILGVDYVGALVGQNEGTIESVFITGGYVKGRTDVGGLVGRNEKKIIASYATSPVEGNLDVGGLVGYNRNGEIENSYATGRVEGPNGYVGGLVGYNAPNGTITASYATGTVTGGDPIGGLVGRDAGTITASHFDEELTEQPGTSSRGITAYYTSNGEVYTADNSGNLIALIVQTDFDSNYWDFDTIWAWQGDGQWPILKFETE